MRAADFITAARAPLTLQPQKFGPWEIIRHDFMSPPMTALLCDSMASLHLLRGEVVMEDSDQELSHHLPIWMAARGRVLKTGLGLGCVVRGLLIKPEVEHIDVIEIDPRIIRVIGAEFEGNPRVTIHHADALKFEIGDRRWDFAWHDIWCDGNNGLQDLHAQLMRKFWEHVEHPQGAWAFPREVARRLPVRLLGAPKIRRKAA